MKRGRLLLGLLLVGSALYLFGQSVTPAPTEKPSVQSDELKFVVALFRHGVRSPTTEFQPTKANDSSRDEWPNEPPDWKVMPQDHDCDQDYPWGYLTQHGQKIAEGLGIYYGTFYAKSWGDGFKVYLWADGGNQRTRATAQALADGFKVGGLPESNVRVESLPNCQSDPLFHPFQSKCGNPDPARLNKFVNEINANWKKWAANNTDLGQLYKVLACFSTSDCNALSSIYRSVLSK